MDINIITMFTHWTKGHTIFAQYQKLREEEKETTVEYGRYINVMEPAEKSSIKQALIGELFDIMTAAFNLIAMLEPNQDLLQVHLMKHAEKLKRYDKTKYAEK